MGSAMRVCQWAVGLNLAVKYLRYGMDELACNFGKMCHFKTS